MKELSPDLFIRISHPWETVKLFVEKIEDKCTSVAVYQHDADEDVSRTHCHMVLKGIQLCRKQVLNYMKDSLDLKGNADFATEKCDERAKPFIYMSKGILDPVFLKGYSAEQALDWKSRWVTLKEHPEPTELDLMYLELCMDMRSVPSKLMTWKTLMDYAYACVKSKRKYRDTYFFNLRKTLVLTWIDDYNNDKIQIPRSHKWAEDMPEHLVTEPLPKIFELSNGTILEQ